MRSVFNRMRRRRRRSSSVATELVASDRRSPPAFPSPPPPPAPPPPPVIPPLRLSALDDGIRRSGYMCTLPSHDIPHSFRCPITSGVMSDPVILPDGFSYEREAIAKWIEGRQTSPCTGKRLDIIFLLPNHTLRDAIREVCDA